MRQAHSLVVLDRDGVINADSDAFIKSPQEWVALPGSLEAIASLKKAGFQVAIATNQSGLKRGYYDRATFYAMQQKLHTQLAELAPNTYVDWVSFSPYLNEDASPARKPNIGMLQAIQLACRTPLVGQWFIGDALSDLQAARQAQMQPILLKSGKGQRTLAQASEAMPWLAQVPVFDDLAAAVARFLTLNPAPGLVKTKEKEKCVG